MTFEDYQKIQSGLLSTHTVLDWEHYQKYVEAIYDTDKKFEMKVGERGCGKMSMMREYCEDNKDIHFLFDGNNWDERRIDKMTSSHIINTLLMLRRRANEFKLNYELFVIDHSNDKLLVPKDNINDLAKKDSLDWMIETPVYIGLLEELEKRNLADYFDVVLERSEKEEVK